VRDTLVTGVLEELIGNSRRGRSGLVRYLARRPTSRWGQRMVGRDWCVSRRPGGFAAPRFRPVDLNSAAWPIVRVAQKLAARNPIVMPDVVLAV